MARIRTIKPEFWTDAKVVRLSPLARLMFVGIWNFADDYGCVPPDAFQLKLKVLPTEVEDADKLVAELFDAGLLEALQTPDAREFWHVTNWSKHQRVSKPSDSEWGLPTDWKPAMTGAFAESPALLPERSENPPSGRERKGKEGSGTEGSGVAPKPARERDPIWDCLVELFGPAAPNTQGLYGTVRKYLVEQDATPEQMRERSAVLFAEWADKGKGKRFGPGALMKWWGSFDGAVGQSTEVDVEAWKRERREQAALAEAAEMDRKALEA